MFKRQQCQPAVFVAQRHLQSKEAVKRAVEWHKWEPLLVSSHTKVLGMVNPGIKTCSLVIGFDFPLLFVCGAIVFLKLFEEEEEREG